ncbi:hypothetical protein JTM32_36525, partial [Pseudomonas aeruginosa]|nr:hypothetical protein [Pseudomonas aeruginosa]
PRNEKNYQSPADSNEGLAIRPSIFDREIRKSCRFFKNQPERCGTAEAITSPSPSPKTANCDVPHGHLCFLASGQFWLSVARRCQ